MKRVFVIFLIVLQITCFLPVALSERTYSFQSDYDSIEQNAKSVFYVDVYDAEMNWIGSASGFVAFHEHLFVTNQHVIDGASYLVIWDENDNSYLLNFPITKRPRKRKAA